MSLFSVMTKLNTLSGAVNNINMNMSTLSDRISSIAQEQRTGSQNTVNTSDLEEIKRSLIKIQGELASKHIELKKDIETIRRDEIKKEVTKEAKLLETMLMHKVEQLLNKSLKDRTSNLSDELKRYVDITVASSSVNVPSSDSGMPEDDNYEIAVTLAGETPINQEKPKRKTTKKRVVDV